MYVKGDFFGVFYMCKVGIVIVIKLFYIFGEVGCIWNGRSKWGCSDFNNIVIVIIDD